MAGDMHDVVGAAQQPDVAVLVVARAVTGVSVNRVQHVSRWRFSSAPTPRRMDNQGRSSTKQPLSPLPAPAKCSEV